MATTDVRPRRRARCVNVDAVAADVTIDASAVSMREVNRALRTALADGRSVVVTNPGARHNIGVALLDAGDVRVAGSAGYYCAGMNDGATVHVEGSAGWGLAETMLSGTVVVDGSAGMGAAASIRGGTVVVRGDGAARAGISMKGGRLIIGGNAGTMTGFMMQKGTIIICGDAADGLADSMYEGVIFVGGEVRSLGNDAVIEEPTEADLATITDALAAHDVPAPARFRKVVSGRQLWNFTKDDLQIWREAL